MPSLRCPYNYCERDDDAQVWATVTEYELRYRRFQRHSFQSATKLATLALRRLANAIGGPANG